MNTITYPKELRGRWYLAVRKRNLTVKDACALFGISRETYYKWYRIDHGKTSNNYRSVKRQPNTKLTPDVCVFIESEKKATNYGPLKMKLLIKRRLGIELSTTIIYRFFKRRKLITRPQKKLPWYTPLKEPIIPVKPGEVVQLDTKYVWLNGKRRYQRTFVDIYTGFQQAVVVNSLEAQDTIMAFKEVIKTFPFVIFGIQTDNGSENRGDFHQYLGQRGIAHYFTPKRSPNWNGAVERAHGVIDQEYYLNPMRPWKDLASYLYWYNHERIHLGRYLKGRTPMEKLDYYLNKVSVLTVN
ncbi:MAG: DDE-type integrase/transposase/recombinase [Patescibacteria group bacterium]